MKSSKTGIATSKKSTATKTTTKEAPPTPNNNFGSAILALSAMLSASYGRKPNSKSIGCQIALEKAGMIRPIANRVESGLTLTESGYAHFKGLAKAGDEGAAKVIKIANDHKERVREIAEYKASQLSF